jgi:hypothetical protein
MVNIYDLFPWRSWPQTLFCPRIDWFIRSLGVSVNDLIPENKDL